MNVMIKFPTPLVKLRNILIGFIAIFAWSFIVNQFLHFLYPPTAVTVVTDDPDYTPPPFAFLFFFTVLWPPIWEELVFRHAPGLILKQLGNNYTLPIMIISSYLFAEGHSAGIQMNMIRQGIMGMIMFYVYLKNGYSYWSSMLLHILWNGFIFFSPDGIW